MEQVKKMLQMDKKQWGVILLLGVLLAVISLPVGKKDLASAVTSGGYTDGQSLTGSKETKNQGLTAAADPQSPDVANTDETILEQKLASLLSGVEGIGRTQVLLMTQETSGDDFYKKSGMKVTGVLISAQGADNSVVIQNIKEAVMALFQIEAHKIKVMKMK